MTKKPQIEKFRETARALGADTDEAAFDAALRRVSKPVTKQASGPVRTGPKLVKPKKS